MNQNPQIFGIEIRSVSLLDLLHRIKKSILIKKNITILSGNIHSFNLAYKLKWLHCYMKTVDLIRLDGEGIRFICTLKGYKMHQRITWADFGWSLAEFCSKNKFSIYLLGGKENRAKLSSEKMKLKYPNLKISGYHHGYFNKDISSKENFKILKMINNSNSDILIVGFGMPIQEKWLLENRDNINVPIVMTGGAVFDYLSGNTKRGSKFLIKIGHEWLARLIVEPIRLWKRYFFGIPMFFLRLFLFSYKGKN